MREGHDREWLQSLSDPGEQGAKFRFWVFWGEHKIGGHSQGLELPVLVSWRCQVGCGKDVAKTRSGEPLQELRRERQSCGRKARKGATKRECLWRE